MTAVAPLKVVLVLQVPQWYRPSIEEECLFLILKPTKSSSRVLLKVMRFENSQSNNFNAEFRRTPLLETASMISVEFSWHILIISIKPDTRNFR